MLSVFGVEVSLKTLTLFLKNLVERSAVFALRSGTLVLSVRRFGASEIASKRQKVEGNGLLGQPTHLALKDKGESSMSEKRGSAKAGSVVVPASPARTAKPVLVEPQSPVAQT